MPNLMLVEQAAKESEYHPNHIRYAAERAANAFDPRAARVHQLILENKSAKEIIGEIWGTNSGDSYRKASAEYQAIVRQLVRH